MENYSSLSCEIQIIRASNVERTSLGGSLFVRCYLSSGEDQRVQINSQELIPSKSADHLFWDESFSLDCSGTQDSINRLKQAGSVVVELHSRKNIILPILGGSKMLGRAEIPWRSVFESKNMEIVEWAIMDNKENHVKPMAVQIAMKVKINTVKETIKVKKKDYSKVRRSSSSCACMDYCGCNSSNVFRVHDYQVFALGAALGAL